MDWKSRRNHMWFKSPVVRAAILLCLTYDLAKAEKYALLIGINRYSHTSGVDNLEGPVNDVVALRRTLVSRWQFNPENVRTLVDDEATRSRILNAIDSYASVLKKGDFLFFFYSGHGTSWFAKGMPQTGITVDTGAIVSSDLKLIIGNLDLQPRLRKLDAVAEVFAVFDSCYSGNSIKSIAVAPSRYVPPEVFKSIPTSSLAQYDRQFSDFQRFTSTPEIYPYQRVLYLSAASKAEQAADIQTLLILHGFKTVDGLPHGALTNALLRGLQGEADTNHDNKITYEELYQFVRKSVTRQFAQTPQLLFPATDPRIVETPVFSVNSAPVFSTAVIQATTTPVSVKLEGSANALRATVSSMPGITISEGLFDLLVRSEDDGFELYHQSGTLIQRYAANDQPNLLLRIKTEPEVRKLIDFSYARQNFNISLTLEPQGHGFYTLGDRLRFRARTEQDCYFLLLDIDVSGMVTTIYPRSPDEIVKATAGQSAFIGPESVVTKPTGMEYLKLFAFRKKPPGLDELSRDAQSPLAPGTTSFERLLRILGSDDSGRATTQVKLVTTE